MLGASMILVIYLAALVCIPVLVGVYVYRDANSRGMNAALWTLISILAPALIGFIVYLLVRGSYSDMKCPKCGTSISEQYVSCPNCGEKLKATCPSCSAPVETEWKVCPRCAITLPEQYDNISMAVKKQDKALGKILIAVIFIPVILILVMVFSFSAFTSSSGGIGVTSLPIDEYLQEVDNTQIKAWLDGCGNETDKAYVLRNVITSEKQTEVQYLIYMPCLTEMPHISIGQHSGLLSRTINLEIANDSGNAGNTLLLVSCIWDAAPNLKISYAGSKIDCETTDVNYSLALPYSNT